MRGAMMDVFDDSLIERFRHGDVAAVSELFLRHRRQLRSMVELRMDQRVSQRIDPSDVLQEAFVDLQRRIGEYVESPTVPPFIWVRALTLQRLLTLNRFHLGTMGRDARREQQTDHPNWTYDSSCRLAEVLIADSSSPSQKAARHETFEMVRQAIESLDPIDQEIIALRHFEELDNTQTSLVLGLKPAAASNRYVRALMRLKNIVSKISGFFESPAEE